jgi:hypothetical protein
MGDSEVLSLIVRLRVCLHGTESNLYMGIEE